MPSASFKVSHKAKKLKQKGFKSVKNSELVVWLNIQEFVEHFTGSPSVVFYVKCGYCVSPTCFLGLLAG